MPNQHMTEAESKDIVEYMKWIDANADLFWYEAGSQPVNFVIRLTLGFLQVNFPNSGPVYENI